MGMRILVVEFRDPEHPQAGGAERLLKEVFGRIARRGHHVDYLCCRAPGAVADVELDGLHIHRRGPQPVFNWLVPWICSAWGVHERYDIVVEGLDKVPFFLPLVERRVPVVAHVPHLFGETIFREANWLAAAYVWAMERPIPWVYRRCRFSALSESTRDDLIRRGVRAEHIRVIHPGLDRQLYRPPEHREAGGGPTVLYVGRLKKYKQVELVLDALVQVRQRVPQVRFEIVGVGDHERALRKRVCTLNLQDHVEFAGWVSETEKVRRMQNADVLVYTSPKEGWGLSVLEANACGTPVVASDSPGLREAVAPGQSGLLVPHGDVDALAQALTLVLTDSAVQSQLRAGALEWAARFTWDRAANEMEQLLMETRREFEHRRGVRPATPTGGNPGVHRNGMP